MTLVISPVLSGTSLSRPLGFADVMATIPYDKTVVIYCGTGHNSAFATAFLRLFGYDARTLEIREQLLHV